MEITQSTVALASRSRQTILHQRQERLEVQPPRPVPTNNRPEPPANAGTAAAGKPGDKRGTVIKDEQLALLAALVEAWTGRKVEVIDPSRFAPAERDSGIPATQKHGTNPTEGPRGGFRYTVQEQRVEQERLAVAARAEVRTADGRSLEVDLELRIDRTLVESNRLEVAGGTLKDPLVVNFDRPSAALGARNYRFDLDADGHEERIALPEEGSGFLALDRNGDGRINDGQELFGPETGSGFDELAEHDQDGDGWIDEGDPVFKKLKVWARAGDEAPRLLGLGEVGVGAIHLSRVASEMAPDESGRLAETGLFLRENGEGGTVQEVDLRV